MEHLLSIGGFDPSAHAGVLADARVFERYKIPHQSALTAVTAQSKARFLTWEPVPPLLLKQQLRAVGVQPWGVKIGMLATKEHLKIIHKWLEKERPRWVVWDPVLKASLGATLFQEAAKNKLALVRLLKVVHCWTPNIPEAEWFLGKRIHSLEEMEMAAVELYQLVSQKRLTVILKGGHLPRQKGESKVRDVFYNGRELKRLSLTAKQGSPRGTGCTFASALLVGLAQRKDVVQASAWAQHYVQRYLFCSTPTKPFDAS